MGSWSTHTGALAASLRCLNITNRDQFSVIPAIVVIARVGLNPKSILLQVCWNSRGDKVGASASDGTVFVLDLRK